MRTDSYLDVARFEFCRTRTLAEAALDQLSEPDWFANPQGQGNSVAVLVKHLAGNMRSRWRDFLTSDGEKPDRDRDAEFVTENDTRAALTRVWEAGWSELFAALDGLADDDLSRPVTIRGEVHTVLQAIARQQSHYAFHVGQIVLLAKALAMERWVSLSIPKGESRTFNAGRGAYMTGRTRRPE